MVLKKTDGLTKDAGVDLVAQIGDGGEAGILDLRGPKVFRNGFSKKENDERDGKNGGEVVNARREIVVEVEDLATPGNREQRQPRAGRAQIEDEVHRQLDHESDAAFGQCHEGHQHHAQRQPERVGAHVTEQPFQLW